MYSPLNKEFIYEKIHEILTMKKLMTFSLISAALITTSVYAENIIKEQVIPIEVKVNSSVDIKMTTTDGRPITKIKMLPNAQNLGHYSFYQNIEITTLGMNNQLKVSLGKELELSHDDQQLTRVGVFFDNKKLSVANPVNYDPVENKVTGLLKIDAWASNNTKKGVFKGDLVLQLEEVA